jgi:hypothetical protein
MSERWPPALEPRAQMRFRSMEKRMEFARRKRTADLASWRWAGNWNLGEKR